MGLLSYFSSSSSNSVSPAAGPSEITPPAPVPVDHTPASAIAAPPAASDAPAAPPRPRKKKAKKAELDPNAPYYILGFAGTFFTLGLLISVRQVRRIRAASEAVAAQARERELAEAAAAVARGEAVSIPAHLAAAAAAAAQQGTPGVSSQRVKTSSILSKGGAMGQPLPKELSLPTLKQPVVGASTLAAVAEASTPTTSSSSSAAPLFPPSKNRPLRTPGSPPPVSPSFSPLSTPPSVPLKSVALPSTAFRQLWRDRNKLPEPEIDPDTGELQEPLPPITAGVALKALGALGVATALAFGFVGIPSYAIYTWLGCEEPADFPPLLRQKISELFPSLGPTILRPTESDPPQSEFATLLPETLRRAPDGSSKLLPGFLQRAGAGSAAEDDDDDDEEGEEEEGEVDALAKEGEEVEDLQGLAVWWGKIRQDFEDDRKAEVRKRKAAEASGGA